MMRAPALATYLMSLSQKQLTQPTFKILEQQMKLT